MSGTPSLQRLFDRLWSRYAEYCPSAHRLHELLRARGERVQNDHIALRTFDHSAISLERICDAWAQHGYRVTGEYDFPKKKLFARSLSASHGNLPRVFVSQLLTHQLSTDAQSLIASLTAQVPPELAGDALVLSGRPWGPINPEHYALLADESEYAAWVATFGICANHFTVSVNALSTFTDLAALNTWLKHNGFQLNQSGGEIKGGEEVLLAQSSTIADSSCQPVAGGGEHTVPGAYYEFAERFPDPSSGELFDGFVTTSATRIFESTDRPKRVL